MYTKYIQKIIKRTFNMTVCVTISLFFTSSYVLAGERVHGRHDLPLLPPGTSLPEHERSLDSLERELELMQLGLDTSSNSDADVTGLAMSNVPNNLGLDSTSSMALRNIMGIGSDLDSLCDDFFTKRLLEFYKQSFLNAVFDVFSELTPKDERSTLLFAALNIYVEQLYGLVKSINANAGNEDDTRDNDGLRRVGIGTIFEISDQIHTGSDIGTTLDLKVDTSDNKVGTAFEVDQNAPSAQALGAGEASSAGPILFTLWPTASYESLGSQDYIQNNKAQVEQFIRTFTELAKEVNLAKKNFLFSTTTLSADRFSSLDMTKVNQFAGTLNPNINYNQLLNYIKESQIETASLGGYFLNSLRPLGNMHDTALESKDLKKQMETAAHSSKSSNDAKIYKMAREMYEKNLSDINNSFKQDLSSIKNNVDGPVLIKNNGAMAALIRINKKSSK